MPYVDTSKFGGGTLLERATTTEAGAPLFEEIPGFTGDLTLLGFTNAKVKITSHDWIRYNGRTEQNAAGLGDTKDPGGTLLFDLDNVTHQALLTDAKAGTVRDYRITLPENTLKMAFRGQIGDFSIVAPQGDYVKCTLSFYVRTMNFAL